MKKWEEASRGEILKGEAISLVFLDHPYLEDFFFDPKMAQLKASPLEILELSKSFSSGERLLIQVALDIWSGTGEAKLSEVLERLDEANVHNVLNGLGFLVRGFGDN